MSFCLSIFWAGPPCCQMLAPPLPRRYITILVLKFKNEVQSPKTVYVRELAITAKFQGLIQERGIFHLYKRSPMFVIGNTIYQQGWSCQNHFTFISNERKWCIDSNYFLFISLQNLLIKKTTYTLCLLYNVHQDLLGKKNQAVQLSISYVMFQLIRKSTLMHVLWQVRVFRKHVCQNETNKEPLLCLHKKNITQVWMRSTLRRRKGLYFHTSE